MAGAPEPCDDLRRLEKTDWESVEKLSSQRRAIGNMFSRAADALASGRALRPPAHAWDARRWRDAAKKAPSKAFPLARGKTFEAWSREVLAWAEAESYGADALVSLHRLRALVESETTAPREVLGEIDGAVSEGLSRLGARELVGRLAEDESLLGGGCSFRSPERFGDPSPHADQLDFCVRALESMERDEPLLLCYRTPPSGGKTAAASFLGARLHRLRKAKRELRRQLLVYTCFSNHVRIAVAQMLLAASVPFAVVAGGVASPSFRLCYASGRRQKRPPPPPGLTERIEWSLSAIEACPEPPVVLVCDAASALGFCRRLPERTALFVDEIMAGTETASSRMLEENCRLLAEAPRWTLLASATLPEREDLAPVAEMLARRWAGLRLEYVRSERLSGNLTLVDHEGLVWAPHHEVEDLSALASDLESYEHRHLLRFYAPRALLELLREGDASTPLLLSSEGHRAVALQCIRDGRAALERTRLVAPPSRGDLCTAGASLWPGLTLVIDDPGSYLRRELAPLLEHVPPLRRLLRSAAHDERRRRAPAVVREEERKANRKASGDEEVRTKARRARDDVEEEPEARGVEWPLCSVVNSSAHVKKYGQGRAFPPRLTRGCVPLPEEVVEGSDASLVESALCGVGALSMGDTSYEASILGLCEKMSQIVGGSASIFGTDLSLQRVALLEDCGLDASALHQLCGRAGRTVDRLPVPGQIVLPSGLARRATRAEAFTEGRERLLAALLPGRL